MFCSLWSFLGGIVFAHLGAALLLLWLCYNAKEAPEEMDNWDRRP